MNFEKDKEFSINDQPKQYTAEQKTAPRSSVKETMENLIGGNWQQFLDQLSKLDIGALFDKLVGKIGSFLGINVAGKKGDEVPDQTGSPNEITPDDIERSYPSCAELLKNIGPDLPKEINEAPESTLVESPEPDKMVLTFDVCSHYGNSPDRVDNVIKSLRYIEAKPNFPVTLFVSSEAFKNPQIKAELIKASKYSHVSLQPHGYEHRPVTTEHKERIFKQNPTGSFESAYDEVAKSAKDIYKFTGKKPKHFRSATLYTDAVGVKLVEGLGMRMVSRTAGADDRGGTNKQGGEIGKGKIYLGHAINYSGLQSVYSRLEAERIETVALG